MFCEPGWPGSGSAEPPPTPSGCGVSMNGRQPLPGATNAEAEPESRSF